MKKSIKKYLNAFGTLPQINWSKVERLKPRVPYDGVLPVNFTRQRNNPKRNRLKTTSILQPIKPQLPPREEVIDNSQLISPERLDLLSWLSDNLRQEELNNYLKELENSMKINSVDNLHPIGVAPENQHLLTQLSLDSAKKYAQYLETPAGKWGLVLGTIPFIVASWPFLAAAGEAAASTAAGSAIINGINLAKSTPWVAKSLPWIESALTAYGGAEGVKEVKENGFTPMAALDFAPMIGATPQMTGKVGQGINLLGRELNYRTAKYWRPTWDLIRNGYQGWKDVRTAYKAGAIRQDINLPFFDSFTRGTPRYRGTIGEAPDPVYNVTWYENPGENYILSGEGITYRVGPNRNGIWGITQIEGMPNTYQVHIGGNNAYMIGRKDIAELGKAAKSIPEYSYIGDATTPTSGLIGMSYFNENGKLPSLSEMIRRSKMSTGTFEEGLQPLSANSTQLLNSEKYGDLRYINLYMNNFNYQSRVGNNFVTEDLINFENYSPRQQLLIVNDFLRANNKNARTAFIGKDGKIQIPISSNFKLGK